MTTEELEKCIQEYGTDVWKFCRQVTPNRIEAEDLYQETFLKAMEQIDKIDSGRNPRSYLISIALCLWKNKKRKYAWRNRIADMRSYGEEAAWAREIFPEMEVGVMENEMITREERRMVRQAVAELKERYQIPVLLYYMESFSIEEISGILSIPRGTVKSRLHKARKLLEKELEVYFREA